MDDINPIYHNQFGVAFQWKRNTSKDKNKVQIVFRDTGLLLSIEELVRFSHNIRCTFKEGHRNLCKDCRHNDACRSLLLDTPAPQVTLALSQNELYAVQDLVEGTLFQLNLDNFLDGIL
ncbi:hypothetical protein [uncultured Kriegella sp.]|uniref:hypothetical protein n=1 Tax=uncultured Kriegella sp. TaxID=1798910 RepID=UPI0030D7FC6B|tara:strand:+ start:103350 stop:103706 length:357 start_codon:yes stop_codon:yes gene_type:complete